MSPRAARATLATALLALVGAAACRAPSTTALRVEVESDFAPEAQGLSVVRVAVASGDAQVFARDFAPSSGPWPVSFAVVPRDEGSLARDVRIDARGYRAAGDNGPGFVAASAITRYVRDRVLTVRVTLHRACLDRATPCGPEQTCDATGACVDARRDPNALPVWDRDATVTDAVTPPPDVPAVDALVDAVGPDAVPPDAAPPDAGVTQLCPRVSTVMVPPDPNRSALALGYSVQARYYVAAWLAGPSTQRRVRAWFVQPSGEVPRMITAGGATVTGMPLDVSDPSTPGEVRDLDADGYGNGVVVTWLQTSGAPRGAYVRYLMREPAPMGLAIAASTPHLVPGTTDAVAFRAAYPNAPTLPVLGCTQTPSNVACRLYSWNAATNGELSALPPTPVDAGGAGAQLLGVAFEGGASPRFHMLSFAPASRQVIAYGLNPMTGERPLPLVTALDPAADASTIGAVFLDPQRPGMPARTVTWMGAYSASDGTLTLQYRRGLDPVRVTRVLAEPDRPATGLPIAITYSRGADQIRLAWTTAGGALRTLRVPYTIAPGATLPPPDPVPAMLVAGAAPSTPRMSQPYPPPSGMTMPMGDVTGLGYLAAPGAIPSVLFVSESGPCPL